MIFSILILFSLVSFYWGYSRNDKKRAGIILFFVFSALAVLTKGPLGFLIPSLIVLTFLLIRKDARFLLCASSLWGLGIFIAAASPWYVFMISTYGASFTHEFFYNDHIRRFLTAEHPGNDTWYFYPSSMIGCMFPWSLYVLAGLIVLFMRLRKERSAFNSFVLSWIAVVFIIFQWAHSKLVSYVFPAFPALALIAGDYVFDAASSNNRNRTFRLLSIFMAFILFAIPVVAIFLVPKYSSYLSSGTAPYVCIGLLFVLSALFLFLVLSRWLMKAVLTLAFVLPAIWFIAPFAHQGIEPYVSSKLASEYLVKNYQVSNPIVCSKFLARGVRYYTDKDIVVLGTPKDFFSPHPITFLGSDDEIRNYFRDQKVTYCILEKSSVENIERIAGETFKLSVLKTIGNEYVVEIGQGEAAPSR
jgi:4-amino-4-deoxy-L-arabinose transferase-like glycosyltransferase